MIASAIGVCGFYEHAFFFLENSLKGEMDCFC